MYLQRLKNIMLSKNLSRADIAGLANVSRANLSKWFHDSDRDIVNVETKTLIRLAANLGVSPSLFLNPQENLEKFRTNYLWDYLYPDMDHFVKALKEGRLPALARLVQVSGFRPAIAIAGKSVLKKFKNYARFIKPVRRKELELLWPLYNSTK